MRIEIAYASLILTCLSHSQLLAVDHVLLVVDQVEKIGVYLDKFSNIANALSNGRHEKLINKNRIGTDVLVSFDETKRLLVLCAPQKVQSFFFSQLFRPLIVPQWTLHVFVFDELLSNLQGWASPFELLDWYNNRETITHVCFVTGTGSEEALLVDSGTRARIYSFVTQSFR